MSEKNKRKLGVIIAAAVTSASVLLGSLFSNPNQIINAPASLNKNVIKVVEYVEGDDEDEDTHEKGEEKETFKEKIIALIYRIPRPVRMLVIMPLWALGTLVISLLDSLLALVSTLAIRLGFRIVLTFLLMLAAFVIILKLLFPNLKLKDILKRKTLVLLALFSIALNVMDYLLEKNIEDYRTYKYLLIYTMGTVFICILTAKTRKKINKLLEMKKIAE